MHIGVCPSRSRTPFYSNRRSKLDSPSGWKKSAKFAGELFHAESQTIVEASGVIANLLAGYYYSHGFPTFSHIHDNRTRCRYFHPETYLPLGCVFEIANPSTRVRSEIICTALSPFRARRLSETLRNAILELDKFISRIKFFKIEEISGGGGA